MSRSWQGGSTRAWRKLRARVLHRDGYRCRIELPGCTTVATHVHHTLGKAAGDDPAHLLAACAHCNLKTGQPTADPAPQPRTRW
ncbi:HNH endonuclease signature motif containing protein [Micromonospora sp. CPCC 206060]|uniref:HNH endonuclease n=1 Tax=Micromonospora sp. CPCC 206060 TaxID=3122406 RepID=UPI002FF0D20C